jgi:hypothetical protein
MLDGMCPVAVLCPEINPEELRNTMRNNNYDTLGTGRHSKRAVLEHELNAFYSLNYSGSYSVVSYGPTVSSVKLGFTSALLLRDSRQ